MVSRVTTVQVNPDKFDELTRLVQELDPYIAAVKQSKGFGGLLFLADRTTGKTMMVTQWETEADMLASNSLREEGLAKVAPLVTGAPSTDVFEVLARA
jgi:heme-degrading monooxygenase HmoA